MEQHLEKMLAFFSAWWSTHPGEMKFKQTLQKRQFDCHFQLAQITETSNGLFPILGQSDARFGARPAEARKPRCLSVCVLEKNPSIRLTMEQLKMGSPAFDQFYLNLLPSLASLMLPVFYITSFFSKKRKDPVKLVREPYLRHLIFADLKKESGERCLLFSFE